MNGAARPTGTLYVVGTPIGNLEDLSARAAAVLAASALVACEDTRRTRILLTRRGIEARLLSYHKFNETRRLPRLLEVLGQGASVALVSDGGTPGVSDPGALLVRAARMAGHRIVPIPGPSAVTALLSASGFPSGPFTFVGFLPHRAGERRRGLDSLRGEPRPLLFFESPRRILATLRDALEVLGDREAVLGRELTKLHEEILAGSLREVMTSLAGREVRGEIAFLVSGAAASIAAPPPADGESPPERVRRLIRDGMDRKEALRRVARETGVPRRELYREMLRTREEEE